MAPGAQTQRLCTEFDPRHWTWRTWTVSAIWLLYAVFANAPSSMTPESLDAPAKDATSSIVVDSVTVLTGWPFTYYEQTYTPPDPAIETRAYPASFFWNLVLVGITLVALVWNLQRYAHKISIWKALVASSLVTLALTVGTSMASPMWRFVLYGYIPFLYFAPLFIVFGLALWAFARHAAPAAERIPGMAKLMAAGIHLTKVVNPKRWRLRFGLRTLFLLTALAGLFFASIGNMLIRVHRQRVVIAKIESLGGTFYYDYQLAGEHIDAKPPPGPKLVRCLVGDDAFAYVEWVMLEDESKTTDKDLALLTELPELKKINLYGQGITDKGMEHVAKAPNLRQLGLSSTNVTADGLARLHLLDGFDSLTLVESSVNDDAIRHLNKLPNLRRLYLYSTSVTSTGLKHLRDLIHLRTLSINFAGAVADDGLHHLVKLQNLETLELRWTSVTDNGLVHLRGLTRIRKLALDRSAVSDSGLRHIAALPQLTHLWLNSTKIGDEGLAHLVNLTRLKELRLSNTAVSDAGTANLGKMVELRRLEIYNTKITDKGVLHLLKLKKLEHLTLSPNVTKSAATKLKKSLPNCWIIGSDKNGRFNLP